MIGQLRRWWPWRRTLEPTVLDTDFCRYRLVYLLQEPGFVFKHDVDFDVDAAVAMAEFEYVLGVQATFYIMARGEHYNPFNRETAKKIHMICELGHTLGIHVDLELPRDAKTPDWLLDLHARKDYGLLVEEFPVSRRISFHSPPHSTRWRELRGWELALAPEWEHRYVTDSRGVLWRRPEDLTAGKTLVSLHPEWWFWPPEQAAAQRELELLKP